MRGHRGFKVFQENSWFDVGGFRKHFSGWSLFWALVLALAVTPLVLAFGGLCVVALLFGLWSVSGQGDTSLAGEQTVPTIIEFAGTVQTISLTDLEAGGRATTLSWHVVNMTDDHDLRLEFFRSNAYVSIVDDPLPDSGVIEVEIEHPRSFAPPTYRLVLLDIDNQIVDQRTLVIRYESPPILARLTAMATPEYDTSDRLPRIELVSANVSHLSEAQIADGETLTMTWTIRNRAPNSHLMFDQVVVGGITLQIELPRDSLWLPSTGEMQVNIPPPITNSLTNNLIIRLRLVDLFTEVIYDEVAVVIPVGDAILATLEVTAEVTAADTPARSQGVVPSGSLNQTTPAGSTAAAPTLPAPPTINPSMSGVVPIIVQFRADPPVVERGASSVLRWEVEGAVSIDIQEVRELGGLGILYLQLPADGSLTVTPPSAARLMRYVLTARSAEGGVSQQEILVASR